ncbi:MAG: hypothetical protein Q9190_002520 [Brigantiaea leucoxantha]
MPAWVYWSFAVGLFLYQTFDAVDGTQARRTHQSGPLGELFDHGLSPNALSSRKEPETESYLGVDACNTVLEVILFASTMNLGQSWYTILTLFGSTLTFYVQTWDEYFTGTLTLGIVSGPVEGILTLCIVYAITGIMGGGSFWQQSMLQTFGIANHSFIPDYFYNMPFNQWYMVYGGIVLVFNTLQSITHVLHIHQEQKSQRKAKSTSNPLLTLSPHFLRWIAVSLYLWLQPVILRQHIIPFIFYIGLFNAYSVGKIIVAHLTKDPEFPITNIITLPLTFAVIDSLGPVLGIWPSALGDGMYQVAFVFLCMGLGVGVYGSFVYDVITTICDYLDIWCLTIKHPYNEEEEEKKKKK